MARAPIALPGAEISADWNPARGRFLIHPAGLVEGIRPEWDAIRARRAALAAHRAPVVQPQPGRLSRALRKLGRILRGWL